MIYNYDIFAKDNSINEKRRDYVCCALKLQLEECGYTDVVFCSITIDCKYCFTVKFDNIEYLIEVCVCDNNILKVYKDGNFLYERSLSSIGGGL